MQTVTFWKGAAERAAKTAAQSLLATISVGVAISAVEWPAVLSVAATAALLSVLTSIADPDRADTAIATGYEAKHK